MSRDQVLAAPRAVTPYLTKAYGVGVATFTTRKWGQRGCGNVSIASLISGNIWRESWAWGQPSEAPALSPAYDTWEPEAQREEEAEVTLPVRGRTRPRTWAP